MLFYRATVEVLQVLAHLRIHMRMPSEEFLEFVEVAARA